MSVVLMLTQATREEYEGELLFIRLPVQQCANQNAQVELKTNRIYRILDFISVECGYRRKLRPHMFRRAFSMIWAWRFEVGDLQLFSKMLYHNSEVFTRFYTEDDDVWDFLPEAQQELAFDVMEKAKLGEKRLFGGFGKTLRRYSRVLLSSISLLSPDRVHHYLSNLFAKHEYKLVSHADGYCTISPARARYARCSTDGVNPNYANRDEEHCGCCTNFGVNESRQSYWQNRLKAHTMVFETTDISSLREAA